MLALSVGVREAARQMNLNEDVVRQWSSREQWFAPLQVPPTMQSQAVTDVTKPSIALANVLADDALHTRVGLSKAARKVAFSLGEREADALIDRDTSQSARNWTDVASKVHGWGEKQDSGTNVTVNVGVLG